MGWLERYAEELGVPRLTDDEITALLALARDVAHGAERRYAPLSTFLAGVAAGAAEGGRATTVAEAVAVAERLLAEPRD